MPQEKNETLDDYLARLARNNKKQNRLRKDRKLVSECVECGTYVFDGQTRCLAHRQLQLDYNEEHLETKASIFEYQMEYDAANPS